VFGFLAISALVICTPGPDTALTIRNALAGGRRGGVGTALGVATGQVCWTLAASAGIAALLKASQPAFVALRLLGAAYLVWLGVTSLVAAFRGGNRHRALPRRRSAFRQGLLSNLGNPKMAVFFTSLLPQFGHSFGALLALGLAFSTMTFLWLSGYGIVVARVGDVLRRGWIRRAIDAATGAVLVALGVRVVQERG
jgi:threonine/homoserine/homoserine lactone efflux protein